MINFRNYRNLKLEDVAIWERSKKDKVYPAGSTLIQVSATTGNTEYLTKPSKVESKYAVITANEGVNARYLNIVINKNVDHFISKYRAGLNIQIDDLKHMDIQLHDKETQDVVVMYIEKIENEIDKELKLKNTCIKTKKRFTEDMFI